MQPESFANWLAAMTAAGLISSKRDAASLLGVTDDTITAYLRRGADLRTALACRALFHRLEPWPTV